MHVIFTTITQSIFFESHHNLFNFFLENLDHTILTEFLEDFERFYGKLTNFILSQIIYNFRFKNNNEYQRNLTKIPKYVEHSRNLTKIFGENILVKNQSNFSNIKDSRGIHEDSRG